MSCCRAELVIAPQGLVQWSGDDGSAGEEEQVSMLSMVKDEPMNVRSMCHC